MRKSRGEIGSVAVAVAVAEAKVEQVVVDVRFWRNCVSA